MVLDATDGNGGTVNQSFTIDIVLAVLSKNGGISFTNPNYVNKNGAVNTSFGLSATGAVIAVKDPPPPAIVGDLRDGGVVFWVDPADNTHGKVCALDDPPTTVGISPGLDWTAATTFFNNYTNLDTGTGVYSNWYLPNKNELQLMYANLHRFGCATNTPAASDSGLCATRKGEFNNYYWSSTEFDGGNATVWYQYFINGFAYSNTQDATLNVRAVRAF